MKLSLRWIFDHIDADYKKVDIVDLVDKFNKITAEIEGYEKFTVDLSHFALVQVKEIGPEGILVTCPEWGNDIVLSGRDNIVIGQVYLVKRSGKDGYEWASVSDFGCPKEGLVPALYVSEKDLSGGWKKTFEAEDYIIEVDNKSITHRPDMWGHRGFAREVAAICDFKLKPEGEFLKDMAVKEFASSGKDEHGFVLEVKNPEIGKRFAGLYMPNVKNRASSLWMASRLMRVGSRPIDFIVDVTNYVMQDISQPMHAFDVNKLSSKKIVPRLAKKGEKLVLLDDIELELGPKDYVITDGKKPVALAGVMGGKDSGIDVDTNSIFIESANFDAASVRNSAIRAKNRTEASSRFEKSLDPNQNVSGIFRLLKLFDDEGIEYTCSSEIMSLGKKAQELEIDVSHEMIEKLLGAKLDPEFVVRVFEKLDFGVQKLEGEKEKGKEVTTLRYKVTVPTFRCTKDIEIKEDLVEEVGRFFGYENTEFVLPRKGTAPYDLSKVLCARKIKKLLSFGLKMREVRNYSFYDESFLAKLQWEPKNYKEVANPVSENWCKLVTSLVPHLIKNVEQNHVHYDQLRFFEWARVWSTSKEAKDTGVIERKSLAGIFFDKHKLDFYCAKSWVNTLFNLLDMKEVKWEKCDEDFVKQNYPWYFPYQTAKIIFHGTPNNTLVGYAGKLDPAFFGKLFEGEAFAFELDGDFIVDYKPEVKKFVPISKYPEVARDVSMFVPLNITVDKLKDIISSCDEKIKSVELKDFFQKDEWKDKKSLTFRFIMQDYNKTLDKREVDFVYDLVVAALEKVGAELR
ncbi:phenylalanine--tRNA ligase subunit beta [Candidatus Dependentiae bacterium]